MKTRALILGGALVAGMALPAGAVQQRVPLAVPAMDQDTPPPAWRRGMTMDTARQRLLREQVQQRFGLMVQRQLRLTEPQMTQLRSAMRAHTERRRELGQRETGVRQAILDQMQPGRPADQDSLNRLLQTAGRLRVERAEQEQRLERELNFLDPVQRTRYLMMLKAFEERVQDIRRRAMGAGAGMGGGMGQGLQPRRPFPRPNE
jgi:hypothetical protein